MMGLKSIVSTPPAPSNEMIEHLSPNKPSNEHPVVSSKRMSSNILNLYELLGTQRTSAELLLEESRAPKYRTSIVDTIILKARASLQQRVTSADGPALGNNGLPLSIKDLSKGCDNLVFMLVFTEDGDAAQHRLILRKPQRVLHADAHGQEVVHEKEEPLPINMHTPSV